MVLSIKIALIRRLYTHLTLFSIVLGTTRVSVILICEYSAGFAAPAAVGKRVNTCGFYPLNSRSPLFLVWRRPRPATAPKFGYGRGFSSVCFSTYSQCQIPYCYTYGFYSTQARHKCGCPKGKSGCPGVRPRRTVCNPSAHLTVKAHSVRQKVFDFTLCRSQRVPLVKCGIPPS